jgi:hypothetical protein
MTFSPSRVPSAFFASTWMRYMPEAMGRPCSVWRSQSSERSGPLFSSVRMSVPLSVKMRIEARSGKPVKRATSTRFDTS